MGCDPDSGVTHTLHGWPPMGSSSSLGPGGHTSAKLMLHFFLISPCNVELTCLFQDYLVLVFHTFDVSSKTVVLAVSIT